MRFMYTEQWDKPVGMIECDQKSMQLPPDARVRVQNQYWE